MANVALHREKLVETAIRLFREKGYAGTGLAEILKRSGAPKGSLYYYFPGGKEALAVAALQQAGSVVQTTLEQLAASTDSARAFIDAYCTLLAGWMEASSFKAGCPITTTVLETVPGSETLTQVSRRVFDDWAGVIGGVYIKEGCSEAEALELARFAIAAIEGSLIQARVERSSAFIRQVAKMISRQ